MRKISRLKSLLLLVSLLITYTRVSFADDSYRIDGVAFEGNRRVDTAAMKQQLKKTSGTISSSEISESTKALFKTGFFDQVNASVDAKSGKNVLVFTVVEKPLVRKVFIVGNEGVSESDLSEILSFGTKRFLDKTRIESLERTTVSYYQGRGYHDAVVDHSVVPVGDNQVDLTFKVNEGKRYKIREISFRGLSAVDEDDLRDTMQTKKYKWWSSWLFGTGRLNADMLENDRALMRQFFLDHGLIDGSIGDPIVEKRDDGIHVSFDVNEGKEYKIGTISASGDLVEGDASKTIEDIESETGEVFNASKIREDSFKVSEKFTDKGFAFANVVPDTNVNREAGTVDVTFTVNKGKPVTVNQIGIHGNDKTYDNVIRREMAIGEQDQYSSSKIKRSQQLLQRLGYFEEVNITNAPVPGEDDKVDLSVNVREASTGTFSAGVGYSTSDGALLNARVAENNILGTGRRAEMNFDLGTERNSATLSFTDRRVNDSNLSLGGELLRTSRKFDDFDRVLMGGGITAGYPLEAVFGEWAQDISAGVRYDLLDINIKNVDTENAAQLVIDSAGKSTSSSVTPSLVRNTIDNPLNPRKGSQQTLSYEYAGLGGDQEFDLFEAKNQWYQPLFDTMIGEFVFSLRTRFAYGQSNNDDPFPLFKRYFPGGINSVRGYKSRRLGPHDEKGNEFGGSKQFINNSELIFPLINSAGLKGILFHDIGEAFDDNQNIDFGELREAWGTGIRWTSPLGPIRLEFGFPIDRKENENSMVTMFSFGTPL